MKMKLCPGCHSSFTFVGVPGVRSAPLARNRTTNQTKSPLLLHCGHTFCDTCMTQYVKKRPNKGNSAEFKAEISCPSCKTLTLMPNGVSDLPVNIYLSASILSNLHSKVEQDLNSFVPSPTKRLLQVGLAQEALSQESNSGETAEKMCGMCEQKKANVECKDCENILCSSCFQTAHKISAAIRHHQPVPFEQDVNANKTVVCKEHKRPIEYFCRTDNSRICSRCYITGEHKQHDIQSFEEKNSEFIDHIDQELMAANSVLTCLKKIDKKILGVMPLFKAEAKAVIEDVSSHFLHLHSLLQVKEMKILEDVCKAYDNGLKMLEEKRMSSELSKHKLDNTLKEAKRLSDNSSLVVDAQVILEEMRNAKTIPCVLEDTLSQDGSLKWQVNGETEITTAIDSLGNVVGNFTERVTFKTSEESPIDLTPDDDTESVCSTTSSATSSSLVSSLSGKELIKRSSSISSRASSRVDDMIFDEASQDTDDNDGDHCRRRSKKALKEVISIPAVKGPPQKVIITHIYSPSSFYVQLASNKKKLETLSHNMNIWCRSGSANKHIPLTLEKNMMVLAKFSLDKQWYRARVLSVDDPPEGDESKGFQVSVIYVDFGNEEVLEMKDLRIMQDRFMLYPEFKVLASLFDIAPADEDCNWDSATVNEFAKLTDQKLLIMSTLAKNTDGFAVDLTFIPNENVSDDMFISVRDVLIFLELARFKHHSDQAKRKIQQPSYSKEEFISATLVKSGSYVDIEKVTHAKSPSDFYVVASGDERDYYKVMMSQIQTMYNGDKSSLFALYYPRPGVLCVAKAADGNWYRAKVIAPPAQKQVKVVLVDIGEEMTVHYDWLRKIHKDFIKLPVQALHCRLADIGPTGEAGDCWSEEVKLWSATVLQASHGTAQFVSWGDPSDVVFWFGQDEDVQKTKSQSLNTILVGNGAACSTGPGSVPTAHTPQHLPMEPVVPLSRSARNKRLSTSSSSTHSTPVNSPTKKSSARNTPISSPRKALSPRATAASPRTTSPRAASPKKAVQKYSPYSPPHMREQLTEEMNGLDISKELSPKTSPSARRLDMGEEAEEVNRFRSDFYVDRREADEVKSNTNVRKRPPLVNKKLTLKTEHLRKASAKPRDALLNDVQETVEKAKNEEVEVKESRTKDKKLEVIMSHYVSPSDFRIRIKDKEHELADLMQALQTACCGEDEEIVPTWKEESNCAVLNPAEGIWYRGLIKKMNGADSITVELEDYGWSIDVTDMKCLKVLSPQFCKTDAAAIKCFIADLIPAGSIEMHKWSRTGIDYMSGEIFDKTLYVKLMGDTCEFGVPVDIIIEEVVLETAFDPASINYKSIRDLILKEGYAMAPRQPSAEPSPDQVNPFFRTIFGRVPQKSCEAAKNNCDSPSTEPQAGSEPREQLFKQEETLQMVKLQSLPQIPTIPVWCEIKVLPTFVDHDGVIYAQPIDWEASISQMSAELQAIYKDMAYTPVFWEEGQHCVAKFPEDDLWYRAQVMEVRPNNVKVLFTDFGNSEWVPLHLVREMVERVSVSHPLALPCVLHEVEPSGGEDHWPTPVLTHLHEMVVNHNCTITVRQQDDKTHVILVTLKTSSGVEFPSYLVEKSLARDVGDISYFYNSSAVVGEVWNNCNPYTLLDIPEAGSQFRGQVTHVELPNLIYVMRTPIPESLAVDIVTSGEIADTNAQLSEFEQMQEDLNRGTSMPLVDLPDVGTKCAGKFSVDDCWYRALCVEQYPATVSCKLVFVDYGTVEEVSLANIRILPMEFWAIPAQAMRCYFNIIPPNNQPVFRLSSHVGVVSALVSKELQVKVSQRHPATVDLYEQTESGELIYAYEKLILDGLALMPAQLDGREVLAGSEPDVELDETSEPEVEGLPELEGLPDVERSAVDNQTEVLNPATGDAGVIAGSLMGADDLATATFSPTNADGDKVLSFSPTKATSAISDNVMSGSVMSARSLSPRKCAGDLARSLSPLKQMSSQDGSGVDWFEEYDGDGNLRNKTDACPEKLEEFDDID